MGLFITNQKKLAAAVGITPCHMSNVIRGVVGFTDGLGDQLETATGISKFTWAKAGKNKAQLTALLKKFYKEQALREDEAFAEFARLNSRRAKSIKREARA